MQITGKMKEMKEKVQGFSFKCLENGKEVIKALKFCVTGRSKSTNNQFSSALSTLAVAIAGSEMVGAHKFLEGKIKLIVRSFSEPVLFPFDDKVGRTMFSPNGVESLGKKLTSCSTKDIGDDEAYCSFLRVEGMLLVFILQLFK